LSSKIGWRPLYCCDAFLPFTLGEVSGDGGGVGGGLQLLALLSVQPLLVPVDVDDVLVSGVRLSEGIQLIHLPDVFPEVC